MHARASHACATEYNGSICLTVDESYSDAQALRRPLHAAEDQVSNREPLCNLRKWQLAVAIREGGMPADDGQSGDLREIGDQRVGEAVGEVVLGAIIADVAEGQHREARLDGRGSGAGVSRREVRSGERHRRRGRAELEFRHVRFRGRLRNALALPQGSPTRCRSPVRARASARRSSRPCPCALRNPAPGRR